MLFYSPARFHVVLEYELYGLLVRHTCCPMFNTGSGCVLSLHEGDGSRQLGVSLGSWLHVGPGECWDWYVAHRWPHAHMVLWCAGGCRSPLVPLILGSIFGWCRFTVHHCLVFFNYCWCFLCFQFNFLIWKRDTLVCSVVSPMLGDGTLFSATHVEWLTGPGEFWSVFLSV